MFKYNDLSFKIFVKNNSNQLKNRPFKFPCCDISRVFTNAILTPTKTNSIPGSINATASNPRFLSESLHSRTNLWRIFRGSTFCPPPPPPPLLCTPENFHYESSPRSSRCARRGYEGARRIRACRPVSFPYASEPEESGIDTFSDSAILVRRCRRRRHAFTLQITSS